MKRFFKFSSIGIAGTLVQLAAAALYLKLGMNYLWATGWAVETALVHNFVWHSVWTWRGRRGSFWRFQLSNGLLSIASNLILVRLLTGSAGLPPIAANLMAIALMSGVNFWVGDRWVFRPGKPALAEAAS